MVTEDEEAANKQSSLGYGSLGAATAHNYHFVVHPTCRVGQQHTEAIQGCESRRIY
jgi:hypothetical protein